MNPKVPRKGGTKRRAGLSARTERFLKLVTLAGVYGGLLMPLVYTRVVAYPYIFPKMLGFQILVGLTFSAWVVLAARKPEYRPGRSRMLIGLLVWFAAMGVSTFVGACHWRSFFGTQERMTGLFALLHFLAWFTMVTSVIRTASHWRRLLEFQVAVGFVAACCLVILPFYLRATGTGGFEVGERLSGFFGNPIFAGAYQNFNIFFVIVLWQGASTRRRGWYTLASASYVTSLVLAGSRGPVLGLLVGLTVAAMALAIWGGHRRFVQLAVASLAVAVSGYATFLVFIARAPWLEPFWTNHGNLKHFFVFTIDSERTRLWTAAWDGFVARPVFGWGPLNYEIMFDVFYRPGFHSLGINDEPHNWLLGVLSETGLFGLLAFGTLWVTFFWSLSRAHRNRTLSPVIAATLMGAGAGHFVQNLTAFDSPVTNLTTFLLFALVAASSVIPSKIVGTESATAAAFWKWLPVRAIPAVMVFIVIFGSILPGVASAYAASSTNAAFRGDRNEMLELMKRGQRLSTPYRDDQLRLMSQTILYEFRLKKFEDWNRRGEALSLVQQIANQHFANIPSHDRIRRIYARLLSIIGAAEGDRQMLGKADALYRQNMADSPKRQEYIMNYAQFLAELGKLDEAEALYRRAVELDPTMGEPRWELGKFTWMYRKQPEDGARLMVASYDRFMRDGNAFTPRSSLEWQQLAQVCVRTHQLEALRGIAEVVRILPPWDRPTEPHLAIAGYMEQGGLYAERNQVLALARERNPKVAPLVDPVLRGESSLRARRSGKTTQQAPQPRVLRKETTAQVAPETQMALARAP